ncbi:type I polyketide synthase [Actinomadura sp. WMMB 499]|uniref:type I polyketide synthase n=1 Tax=Actinomadura sp. WMMB 499 TaxID=1219491 RepID=UPI00159CFC79|nr:type I polyketide synthase [Actinomadura sp. WMMB 499]
MSAVDAAAIAVVGIGCRYPDAAGPQRLWEMVLAGRRAFRPLPPERLNVDDYAGDGPDSTYARFAAVLEDWTFDRARHRVPGSTYRVTDPTHWLALEVAADTLDDAGFPGGRGLDGDRAGVVLGNTLAGEFSRASLLRLRWPYVRRVVESALAGTALPPAERDALMARLADGFKEPFPEPTDESLVGGLANAIAGRVCNHFDLRGGGYTVDGACASSLLAVTTACTALADGDLDLALAGGVDLSLDPFELVGFARVGALAATEMRVYDARPTGFLPGEGCGMVALMRLGDALDDGRTPLAIIRGWGVSSDGRGGLTRPESDGQALAMRRAYARAGFGPETVPLFEGHGTGTEIGDHAELRALSEAQGGRRTLPPAAIGSVKANIGHTKAAAGAAGLIKATLALHHQVIPPTVGCTREHELLRRPGAPLRTVPEATPWPRAPLRAAVSAMGFGGINTHIVLEGAAPPRRGAFTLTERRLARRPLDAEVFAFAAETAADLAASLRRVADRADGISLAEHIDLAAALAESAAHAAPPFRAAVVAGDPRTLARRARRAAQLLERSEHPPPAAVPGVYLGRGAPGRVGLLFPGQGAPVRTDAGALGALLPDVTDRFAGAGGDPVDTAVAQPAIVRASLAGLRWLARIGVGAVGAVGHSLGEITALCWAGALPEEDGARLAAARGRAMADTGEPGMGMVSLAAPPPAVAELIAGTRLAVAADNGAVQVVAGPVADLDAVLDRAGHAGVTARRLDVGHAFHTAAVAAARPPLARLLRGVPLDRPRRPVHSTVTGGVLTPDDDLRELLVRQVTEPVRFRAALAALATGCDLLVECGPGHSLSTLAQEITDVPVVTLDAGSASAEPVARATGALFAAGAVGDPKAFFAERFHRPFVIDRAPAFLANPCESAPRVPAGPPGPQEAGGAAAPPGETRSDGAVPNGAGSDGGARDAVVRDATVPDGAAPAGERETGATAATGTGPLDAVRDLVADALELPAEMIGDDDGLLSDLHLNSLRVMQLAVRAAERCGRAVPAAPPPLASASVADLAAAVAELPAADRSGGRTGGPPPGVEEWFRVLAEERRPVRLPGERDPRHWQIGGRGPLRALAEPLLHTVAGAPPAHAVFLPEDPGDAAIDALLEAASDALAASAPLTVVDLGVTASGLVGGLAQEHPDRDLRWIGVDAATGAAARTVADALATPHRGHTELLVGAGGETAEPVHRPVRLASGEPPLAPGDVLLVTGGGRGIGLETAAALGDRWGVRLALLGRADPAHDADLRAGLDRLEAGGTVVRYEAADVADPAAVRAAITRITGALGPVRGVVHGSAINRPARFAELSARDFAAHAAPKHHGLRTLLGALDPSGLRLLVTYGSVIGRFGLPGEAHYALANGRLRELARVLAPELPGCRVRNIDWTAWSGAGMGERLDVLDGLAAGGVTPMPVEVGTRLAARIAESGTAATVLATGRLPALHTTDAGTGDGSFRRVRTHTPGVELVAETELSLRDAPEFDDHRIDGLAVLPAVSALEVMARAASALTGRPATAVAGGAFERPIIIPEDGARTVRACALARPDGDVAVVLRSDETDFAVDHFSGTVTGPAAPPAVRRVDGVPGPHDGRSLYGPLFFHGPRFRRLVRFERLSATGCTALLEAGEAGPWSLGDPARNDAAVHVLQACVPNRRLLPVGCARFTVHGDGSGELTLDAAERSHDGAEYVYDVLLADAAGRPVLSWTGLRLHDVGPLHAERGLPAAVVGVHLERGLAGLLPGVRLTMEGLVPSVSGGAVVMGEVECGENGCEEAEHGGDGFGDAGRRAQADRLRRLTGESPARVRARMRTVEACLRKAGHDPRTQLAVQGVYEDGWAALRTRGGHRIVSVLLAVEGRPGPVAVAIAADGVPAEGRRA